MRVIVAARFWLVSPFPYDVSRLLWTHRARRLDRLSLRVTGSTWSPRDSKAVTPRTSASVSSPKTTSTSASTPSYLIVAGPVFLRMVLPSIVRNCFSLLGLLPIASSRSDLTHVKIEPVSTISSTSEWADSLEIVTDALVMPSARYLRLLYCGRKYKGLHSKYLLSLQVGARRQRLVLELRQRPREDHNRQDQYHIVRPPLYCFATARLVPAQPNSPRRCWSAAIRPRPTRGYGDSFNT